MTHVPLPVVQNAPHRLSHPRAFTLVELLVVIGIIALLISILLPALNKARFSANVAVCASNHHQIYTAMAMYANDNRNYLPGTNVQNNVKGADYVNGWGRYPWEAVPVTAPRWYGVGVLIGGQYLPNSRVVECPDFFTAGGPNLSRNGEWLLSEIEIGSDGEPVGFGYANQGSYVLNTVPYYDVFSDAARQTNKSKGHFGKPGRNGGWNAPGPAIPHHRAQIMCLSTQGQLGFGDEIYSTVTHQRRGVNVTYIDGHVRWMDLSPTDWAFYSYSGIASTGQDLMGNKFMWCLASERE